MKIVRITIGRPLRNNKPSGPPLGHIPVTGHISITADIEDGENFLRAKLELEKRLDIACSISRIDVEEAKTITENPLEYTGKQVQRAQEILDSIGGFDVQKL